MIKITISQNETEQRLDRFLKKYLKNAPLSYIYKIIRKDIKVNGKRAKEDTILLLGDEILLYISEEDVDKLTKVKNHKRIKKQFNVIYEDDNILAVDKPFGLLTHGDFTEKKNHLANQVISYLIENGEYVPRIEKTFVPAPVNRLDRNTTGLVLFGKNNIAIQKLNYMLREKNYIRKCYLTIIFGNLEKEIHLLDKMDKLDKNMIKVVDLNSDEGKVMETIARPLKKSNEFTLVEVELITGRTHQIRAHLAKAGYPIIGDSKYGNRTINEKVSKKYGLTTQFLHAYKMEFLTPIEPLAYLQNKVIMCELPSNLERIKKDIFS